MNDDALREVLRSPLDDPAPPRRGGRAIGAVLLLAAAGGFGAVAGARALTGSESPATTEGTTTTIASPVTAATAVMGGVGVEAMAAWRQSGALFVVVSTAVLPGEDPEAVTGVPSAHWVLRLRGGDLLPAAAELTTILAPGMFTLQFPEADLSTGAELLAYPAEHVIERTFTTTRDSTQLPWEGPLDGDGGVMGKPYRLGGQEIAFHTTRLDDAGGELGWYLLGDSVARAVVDAGATYTEEDGRPQSIVPEARLPYAYLTAPPGSAPPARSGGLHLFHLDDAANPTFRSRFHGDPEREVAIRQLVLEVSVRLYRYSAAPAVIPLSLTVAGEG